MKEAGWFELNFSRHLLATELDGEQISPEYIEIQLGHMEGIDHPFGNTSELTPLLVLTEISESINRVLEKFGWESIRSPYKKFQNIGRSQVRCSSESLKNLHESKLFGPDAREEKRLQNTQRHTDVVRKIIKHYDQLDSKSSLTESTYNQIIEQIKIATSADSYSTNRCLLIFYRWLLKNKSNKQWNRTFNRSFMIEKEFSPFNTNTLKKYANIINARVNFIDYLSFQSKKEHLSADRRVAEIIISAALFSYVCNETRLEDIAETLNNRVFQYNELVFVDLKCIKKYDDVSRNVFRWFPDDISLSLITGFKSKEDINNCTFNANVIREINSLLKIIIPGYKSRSPLKYLVKHVESASCIELPGYLRSVSKGDLPSTSLPLSSFTRVISGMSLDTVPDITRSKAHQSSLVDLKVTPSAKTYGQSEGLSFRKRLLKATQKPLKLITKQDRATRKKQKTALSKELSQLLASNNEFPSTAKFITLWVINLCSSGTSNKPDLAYNTVKKYTEQISKPLLSLTYNRFLPKLDEIEFEELYKRSAFYFPQKSRAKCIGVLREFHLFLKSNWPVDSPDWSSIYQDTDCKNIQYLSNANIITDAEYERSIAFIDKSVQLNDLKKNQYLLLMILGYRFGLRFGEAYRIRYIDIQYEKDFDWINIIVRNNRFGEIKTSAASRIVGPLNINLLTDLERQTIQILLSHFEHAIEFDSEIGLMSTSIHDFNLVDRSEASIYINNLLRSVTGDSRVRFHHLRHSWANKATLNEKENQKLFRSKGIFISHEYTEPVKKNSDQLFTLKETSRLIGHSNEECLILSYLHNCDFKLHQSSQSVAPKTSPKLLSYALGIPEGTIRKRISRNKHKDINFIHLINAHKVIPNPDIQLKEFDPSEYKEKTFSASESTISLELVNTLLIILKRGLYNIDQTAESLFLSTKDIYNFVDTAIEIERKSGYTRFDLSEYDTDKLKSPFPKSLINEPSNLSEEQRIQHVLSTLDDKIETELFCQKNLIEKGLAIWCSSYKNGFLILTKPNDLLSFREMTRVLGLDDVLIMVNIPPEQEDYINRGHPALQDTKVSFDTIPLSLEKSKSWKESRIKVSVVPKDQEIATQKTYHRIMFILSVYFSLAK